MARSAGRALGYQPAFDGLRALAIGLVVLVHVYRWPAGGYLGVDLFFVLSGFLITSLLLEERDRHGDVSLTRFYGRRALRLFPALWVFLAASALIFAGLSSHAGTHLKGFVQGFTYTTNLGVVFHSFDSSYQTLWSLAIEEQFYLVWPAVLLVALWLGASRLGLAVVVFGVALAEASARFFLTPAHVPQRFGWETVTRFDSILIGCVAGLLSASASPAARGVVKRLRSQAAFVAALVVMASLVVWHPGRRRFITV